MPCGRARRRPCAHRRDRARPVPARRVEHRGRAPVSCASRRRPTRCRPCVRIAVAHDTPVRRPRRGHRAGRRRDAARRRRGHHADQDEPGPLGRSGQPAGMGRARRAQPRPHPPRRAVHGLHFAPDPSSQQSCSIGGNVANNSGGPHCLADGVTSAHILALEVVLPDGELVDARQRGWRARRLRPARRVRRQRGHVRHRHQGSACA